MYLSITLMIFIFGHLPELSNHCLVYLYPHLKKIQSNSNGRESLLRLKLLKKNVVAYISLEMCGQIIGRNFMLKTWKPH